MHSRTIAAAAAVAVIALGLLALAAHELEPRRAPRIVGSTSTQYSLVPVAHPTPPAAGIAWPLYGYNVERTRFDPSIQLRAPFRLVWTFHAHALIEFPPVVGYDRVYLTNIDGILVALDTTTGRPIWRYHSGRCGWASPALADQLVIETFVGDPECGSHATGGEVVALDAATGNLRWLRHVGPTESSPLIADATTYLGDWSGRIYALNLATGATRWTTQLDGAVKGSLALDGDRLFIGTYAGDLVSLDAASGRVLWTLRGLSAIYSSPAVAHGRVYVGALDGGVIAVGESSGDLLWSLPTGSYVYASPAISRGLVLIGSYDHDFYAIDAATGKVRWRFRADAPISGSATVIDGLVYFSTFARQTYALNVTNGRTVTRWPDGEYSPAVADPTHLYLVGLGRLYAFHERR